MNQREITISTINGLRHSMVLKLIGPLNKDWNDAAFNIKPMDWEKVSHHIKAIKDCSQKILVLCQVDGPWTRVKCNKKRFYPGKDFPPTKVRKIEECLEKVLTE